MRFTHLLLGLFFATAACAVGTAGGDGIVAKKSFDGGTPAHDSGSSNTPSNQDAGTTPTSDPCNGADLTSDPLNCGACGVACNVDETCTNGQCAGATQPPSSGNAPPQGTCSHSLCSSGAALDEACDTQQCTVVICDPSYLDDEFCCTTSWDSQCAQEVTDYCAPYSCN